MHRIGDFSTMYGPSVPPTTDPRYTPWDAADLLDEHLRSLVLLLSCHVVGYNEGGVPDENFAMHIQISVYIRARE